MGSNYPYRLLIIFAALVFCLTVCFANAEVQTITAVPSALCRDRSASMHAGFLIPLHQQLLPMPGALQTPTVTTPVISQKLLNQLTKSERKSHGFWHGISLVRQKPGLVISHPFDNSTSRRLDERDSGIVQGANSTLTGSSDQTE